MNITVAVSPCPNDSFIFGSWVLGAVSDSDGLRARFVWADVEELNQAAEAGSFDVVKVSAAKALDLVSEYEILAAGAAFGLSAGPKLVVGPRASGEPKTVAVPGLNTTAFALASAASGDGFEPVPMRYDKVVDAVVSGRTEAGLLIHETALVYEKYGLGLHLDLGQWWDEATGGLPLPLGVIVCRRSLGKDAIQKVNTRIRLSLEAARTDQASLMPFISAFAQEMDPGTLTAHIEAYVNEYSLDMGEAGRRALSKLAGLVGRGRGGSG